MSVTTCDTCGKPATQWARDFIVHENPASHFAEARPLYYVKSGCDEHPVESKEYTTNLPMGSVT